MTSGERKPTLCLDFDGVLHAYSHGWQGTDTVADGPVSGALAFLCEAVDAFDVCVLSSRSSDPAGLRAMKRALYHWLDAEYSVDGWTVFGKIRFPEHKPPCFVTIDDRAITFTGEFPSMETLRNFTPWNKR